MKKIFIILSLIVMSNVAFGQSNDTIYLIVQGDDIGSSDAANRGCIESYRNGILTVTEVMAPCPWFLQAARLLKENPGLEVGLHLALNSEWSEYKWRPLTHCPSLVDSNGYFYPFVWQRNDMQTGTALHNAKWNYDEVEKELRAQIEFTLKHIPHITHLSGHMGWASIDPRLEELRKKLAKEYHLEINPHGYKINRFEGFGKAKILGERIKNFNENLNRLTPGIYIFVDHPGMNTPEMQNISHLGYTNVSEDRDMVTKVLTNSEIKATIEKKKIKLINYSYLTKMQAESPKAFQLAAIQMYVEPGQKEINLKHAEELIKEAASKGANVVLLPELMDLGWTHSSILTEAEEIPQGSAFRRLAQMAVRHNVFLCCGMAEKEGALRYNAAVIISNEGELLIKHRKLNELTIAHHVYSAGDRLNVCNTPYGRFGLMICADANARDHALTKALCYMGCDVILSPTSWAVDPDYDNVKTPYGGTWKESYSSVAHDFSVWIAGCSNVGPVTDGPWKGWRCIGSSIVIDPSGKEVLKGNFGEKAEQILYMDIAPVKRPTWGTGWDSYKPKK